MADRKITNISNMNVPLAVVVRCEGASDVTVHVSAGETFWCPDERNTKSLSIYQRKGLLEISQGEKPVKAHYYEAYPSDHWSELTSPNTIEDIPAIEHAMQSDENAVKRQDAEVSAVKIVSGAADFPPVVTKESGEWTPEDTSFLMENFLEHGPAFCAQHLGRTQKSVSRKADRMQLKRKIG
mgnify:CR=1 FL=1